MLYGSEPERWSVTDLVLYVYDTLAADPSLQNVWIEGEISNFSQHSKSRHMYFTLKDEQTRIKAAMFAGNNRRLRFVPKNGDAVWVRGYLSMYKEEGQVQFYVQEMRLAGMGELYLAFERLKEQLQQAGLFARPKKPLPAYPANIGVITSPTGAAIRDILTTLERRYPLANVLLLPVSVQGSHAAQEIAEAIADMNRMNEVDVLIVGRGGGSIEELWAFNEEVVARSIDRSSIPVISAVGHETDTTISDWVADRRAATPTAAAELVVPHVQELKDRLSMLTGRLMRAQALRLATAKERLKRSIERSSLTQPGVRLVQYAQRIDALETELQFALNRYWHGHVRQLDQLKFRLQLQHPAEKLTGLREQVAGLKKEALLHIHNRVQVRQYTYQGLLSQLDALSPLKVMRRGYSLVYRYDGNHLIHSYCQAQSGDLIRIRLAEGQLKCQVWRAEREDE
jgi:exodeoxyribonuclease VII large subunit